MERTKLCYPNGRQKVVHAGALSILLLLIGILEDLTSSCSKLFEKFLLLKCYTELSVPKTGILEVLGNK